MSVGQGRAGGSPAGCNGMLDWYARCDRKLPPGRDVANWRAGGGNHPRKSWEPGGLRAAFPVPVFHRPFLVSRVCPAECGSGGGRPVSPRSFSSGPDTLDAASLMAPRRTHRMFGIRRGQDSAGAALRVSAPQVLALQVLQLARLAIPLFGIGRGVLLLGNVGPHL